MADTHEIRKKLRTAFIAQASAAITAGAFSAGAETPLDNTYDDGTENCRGADQVRMSVNVTAAPATASNAEIWTAKYDDENTKYEAYEYALSVDIPITDTDSRSAGFIVLDSGLTKAKIKAIGYAFTAELIATPILPAIFAL